MDPGHIAVPGEQDEYFRFKFISYTAYLIISVYYSYYYGQLAESAQKLEKSEFEFK